MTFLIIYGRNKILINRIEIKHKNLSIKKKFKK